MIQQYRWCFVLFCSVFLVACAAPSLPAPEGPVSESSTAHATASETVLAAAAEATVNPDQITVFIPANDVALQPLQGWLADQQLTDRVKIIHEHAIGQRVDAWLYPRGAGAYYDESVAAVDQLKGKDWSVAQVEDVGQAWDATLYNAGDDTRTTFLLDTIGGMLAQMPADSPELVPASEIEDPDTVMRVQISRNGTLYGQDDDCPNCIQGPRCVACENPPWNWCAVKPAESINFFVPSNDAFKDQMQTLFDAFAEPSQITVVNTWRPGQTVDAWLLPPGTALPGATPVGSPSDLAAANWTRAQIQTTGPGEGWSIGVVNGGGTPHMAQLIAGLDTLVTRGLADGGALPPTALDPAILSGLQVSPEGTLVTQEENCVTCVPLSGGD